MNTVLEKYGPKNFTKRDIINRAIETIVRTRNRNGLFKIFFGFFANL